MSKKALEVGKKYKLRNDNVFLCLYTDMGGDYPILMVNTKKDHQGVRNSEEFTEDGKYLKGINVEHEYDVIGESREVEVMVYAVVLPDGTIHARRDKGHAEYLVRMNEGAKLVEFSKTVEV
jgi:hypothetical protein